MRQLVGAKVESSKLSENNRFIYESKEATKVMNGCINVQRWGH